MPTLFDSNEVTNNPLLIGWGMWGDYLVSCKTSGFNLDGGTVTLTVKRKSNNVAITVPTTLSPLTAEFEAFRVTLPDNYEISATLSGDSGSADVVIFLDKI